MEKYRVTMMDENMDKPYKLNPTAKNFIFEVNNEKKLLEKIKEKSSELIISFNYTNLAFAYIKLQGECEYDKKRY